MIINRYLFTAIFSSCLLLFCLFACLMLVGQVLEQSEHVNQTFQLVDVFWYCLQRLPSQLIELSPVIISIGTLITLALLSHHSELSVLRCSGQSIVSLLHRAMMPALIFLLIIWAGSEFNLAKIEQNAKAQKSLLISGSNDAPSSDSALWLKYEDSYYYLSRVFSGGYAQNIKRWNPNKSHSSLVSLESIESMSYENYNSDNEYWLQDYIRQSTFNSDIINLTFTEFRTSHEMPSPVVLNSLSQDVNKLPFHQLVNLYQQSHLHQIAFWNRLLLPFNIYSLILLSSTFVFSSGRQRDTGVKILIGSCFAIGGYMLQILMPSVSIVFELAPLTLLLLPVLLIILTATFFIAKLK